jgi:response regulator RpfG family c-di-GMP phosphodiesterase
MAFSKGNPVSPSVLHQAHTILLVDDDPAVLSSLRRLLRCEPYEVLSTESPQEALRWVDERPVSLILADQKMPRMSGTELLSEVARRRPGTARLLLTAHRGLTVRLESWKQGVEFLLYKPWDDDKLRRTILDLLVDLEQSGLCENPEGEP